MGKSSKKFYAVAAGRTTGIFESWPQAEAQVKGFPNARFKGFRTREEAEDFMAAGKQPRDQNKAPSAAARASAGSSGKRSLDERAAASASRAENKPVGGNDAKRNRYAKDDDKGAAITTAQQDHHVVTLSIQFDGGSRGNPGLAGAGAVLTVLHSSSPLFRRVVYVRDFLEHRATNNQAEYRGVIAGLQAARREAETIVEKQQKELSLHTPTRSIQFKLIIQGDSNLVIQQLAGKMQCKSENLTQLNRKTQDLIQQLKSLGPPCKVSYQHVYRNDNSLADSLANAAMDARRSWFTTSDDNHESQHSWL